MYSVLYIQPEKEMDYVSCELCHSNMFPKLYKSKPCWLPPASVWHVTPDVRGTSVTTVPCLSRSSWSRNLICYSESLKKCSVDLYLLKHSCPSVHWFIPSLSCPFLSRLTPVGWGKAVGIGNSVCAHCASQATSMPLGSLQALLTDDTSL